MRISRRSLRRYIDACVRDSLRRYSDISAQQYKALNMVENIGNEMKKNIHVMNTSSHYGKSADAIVKLAKEAKQKLLHGEDPSHELKILNISSKISHGDPDNDPAFQEYNRGFRVINAIIKGLINNKYYL